MLNSFWNWFVIILTVVNHPGLLVAAVLDQGNIGPGGWENHHRARVGRLDGTQQSPATLVAAPV